MLIRYTVITMLIAIIVTLCLDFPPAIRSTLKHFTNFLGFFYVLRKITHYVYSYGKEFRKVNFLIQMDDIETKINEAIDSNDDDEQKSKEKLNQRREARRKKILDNAKNRLERLNGRTLSTPNTSTPPSNNEHQKEKFEHFYGPSYSTNESGEFSDPEVEPDIMAQHIRPLLREPNTYSSWEDEANNSIAQQNMQRNESETNNSMDFFNLFATPPPVKKSHILFRARLHLVFSALISCLLTVFWRANGFSIFITPGLCVITDLLFFRESKPLNPTLLMILMMVNARIFSHAQKYFHLIGIVHSIIVDLGVFAFSFCTLLYLIVICTNNRFNDLIVMK